MPRGRNEIFANIPDSYSGVRHLVLVNAMALAALVVALYFLRSPTGIELLVIPATFLFANAVEWQLHRDLLHRRVPGFGMLYDRHSLQHHVAFRHDSMDAPSSRQWRWVLFPAPAFLGLLFLVAPAGFLIMHFTSRNAGLLFDATGIAFYLLYEWCHLSYHQPPDTVVGRLRLVRVLRRHHQRHHHPALARRYNFNVTFPIWDRLRGTIAPSDAMADAMAAETKLSDGVPREFT